MNRNRIVELRRIISNRYRTLKPNDQDKEKRKNVYLARFGVGGRRAYKIAR